MAEFPENPEKVSKEWLHKTLCESLKTENIKILELKPIISKGYVSQALKATIKVNESNPEKVFIKMNVSDNSKMTHLGKHGIYEMELRAYQEILPTLIKYEIEQFGESKLKSIIPKCLAGNHSDEGGIYRFFLILEDLSDNYFTFFNYSGAAKVECQAPDMNFHVKCLESIAYFHALSYSYGQVNSKDYTEFPMLMKNLFVERVKEVKRNLKILKDDMKKLESGSQIDKAVSNLEKCCEDILPKYLNLENSKFLGHCDYWSGNVMMHNENKDCKYLLYFINNN